MGIRGNPNQKAVNDKRAEHTWSFCEVCGKPSQVPICGGCADRIRAEAVARKKREDKGLE